MERFRRLLIDTHAAITGAAVPFVGIGAVDFITNRPVANDLEAVAIIAADAWLVLNWVAMFALNPNNWLGLSQNQGR